MAILAAAASVRHCALLHRARLTITAACTCSEPRAGAACRQGGNVQIAGRQALGWARRLPRRRKGGRRWWAGGRRGGGPGWARKPPARRPGNCIVHARAPEAALEAARGARAWCPAWPGVHAAHRVVAGGLTSLWSHSHAAGAPAAGPRPRRSSWCRGPPPWCAASSQCNQGQVTFAKGWTEGPEPTRPSLMHGSGHLTLVHRAHKHPPCTSEAHCASIGAAGAAGKASRNAVGRAGRRRPRLALAPPLCGKMPHARLRTPVSCVQALKCRGCSGSCASAAV